MATTCIVVVTMICSRWTGLGVWRFQIEVVLTEHPGVREAAVVGRADADGLAKPEAWIVMNEQRADPTKIDVELVRTLQS